ncbi:SGNH hydrolase [Athelia psychrophila]|uniref:SGNH hydrolase n=1 Tax=Athelia psychrophila TaxID=1759441 RepID=A0A166JHW9_9AGAM|nr:SGNH hydrolase [Fibularhizoctonia sp. CBS 109695]
MSAADQNVIMLLGDSITQGGWEAGGFAQQLAYKYARKLDVINRGLSGYNTEWAVPVFEKCFAKQHEQQHLPKVRILTIWFGTNDAAIPPSAQHVPLAAFAANLVRMVRMITSPLSAHYSPSTRIVLITPPPVNSYMRAAELGSRDPPIHPDREFEVTRTYAEAVMDVARQEKLPVADVWTAIYNAAGCNERALDGYLWDGIHLNEKGYKVMYEELMKTISENLPELHYDNLPSVYPPWVENIVR